MLLDQYVLSDNASRIKDSQAHSLGLGHGLFKGAQIKKKNVKIRPRPQLAGQFVYELCQNSNYSMLLR